MRLPAFFKSKSLRNIAVGCALLAFLFLIFKAGEFAGYRRGHFSSSWADSYHRNVGVPVSGFLRGVSGKASFAGHGAYGPIVKIEDSTLTVQGRDNAQKLVNLSPSVTIRISGRTATQSDLNIGDRIVVIGPTNQEGRIEAKFIRVLR